MPDIRQIIYVMQQTRPDYEQAKMLAPSADMYAAVCPVAGDLWRRSKLGLTTVSKITDGRRVISDQ